MSVAWTDDYDRDLELANDLIDRIGGDDLAIALDVLGWKIVPLDYTDSDRWPMLERRPLNPTWTKCVEPPQLHVVDNEPAPEA